jgi:DNA-binding NtrC family response regulator
MNQSIPGAESILIVDDIASNLTLLSETLEPEGYQISVCNSGESALKIAPRVQPNLVLLDVMMPGLDGWETCRRLKQLPQMEDVPVIFITARSELQSIVESFRAGGVDYIEKPFQKEEVLTRVSNHLKIFRLTQALRRNNAELQQRMDELRQSNQQLAEAIDARQRSEQARAVADEKLSVISAREAERWGIPGFVSQSATMAKILNDIRMLHQSASTSVLINGESGTGKELIARAIHCGSNRSQGAFIAVNCVAIPAELAESAFFGHVKGAFTGASGDRKGFFELASGGTLFLDEIGDMPSGLQAKLLRVLEDGVVRPLGGNREIKTSVRVLAATHVDLAKKIDSGQFREDLYYRLARFRVLVPPLRERRDDIPLMAHHFLQLFATEMGQKAPAISAAAMVALQAYAYPGNIRELKNLLERALIFSAGGTIEVCHLDFQRGGAPAATEATVSAQAALQLQSMPLNLKQAEVLLIQRALQQCQGNMSETARVLGVNRATLYRFINNGNNVNNSNGDDANMKKKG